MAEQHTYRLSIIVPVFNEEESLRDLHDEITAAMSAAVADSKLVEDYEVILVDDGSSDSSVDIGRELCSKDPDHLQLLVLRRNFGQTAAMAAGFDAASGDLIVPMDADLQNDPADIVHLVEKIDEGYDVVSGWRADRKDTFLTRRLPSMLANGLISRMTRVHLHDYGCTLKAYRREVTEHMNLYGELHRFLPALASWAGAKVAEIKVNHRARAFGQSKYGLGRTLRVVLDLITVRFLLAYSTKPMQVFGRWGFYSMLLGVGAGALTAFLKIFSNKDVTENPWMYLCFFFLVGGFQLVGLGLLGEINVRTYYESQEKPIYTIREHVGKK